MIVVAGTLRLSPQALETVREIARETIRATRAEMGCITYSFAEDLAEPGLIRIYEEWESRDALGAHGRTAHIAAWRQAVREAGVLSRELKLAEIDGFGPFS